MLRANLIRLLTPVLPEAKRSPVHVEQSHLLAAATAQTVNAEGGQQTGLPGRNQIWSHAHDGAF